MQSHLPFVTFSVIKWKCALFIMFWHMLLHQQFPGLYALFSQWN